MKYYLAIDIGASSGRHILGYMEGGRLHTEEIYRFPNLPERKNGHLGWDAERLFFHVVEGMKEAARIGKIPVSVGIDTWAVDYVLLDKEDRPIGEVYAYRDERTKKVIDEVHKIVPFETLYEHTGIQYQPFNTIYQLYEDKKSGRLGRAENMLMLPDYLHFRLTGEKRQEYCNATSTGLVNARTHEWDKDLIKKLGFPEKLFGTLTFPGTKVGKLRKDIAEKTGYNCEVILPATHDTASSVLASTQTKKTPYISSGTWSLMGVEQPNAHTDERARALNYTNEGTPSGTFRFQKNIMGLWLIQQVRHEANDAYSFATLAEMAEKEPVEDLIDVNAPRFLAPKNMTEEIENAVGRKLTTGQCAYCIFNSLAVSYKKTLDELEELTGQKYGSINIIGGGSQNLLLSRLTARHTGKRIVLGPTETTAIGNLLEQMIGNGEIGCEEEGRKIIAESFDVNEIPKEV